MDLLKKTLLSIGTLGILFSVQGCQNYTKDTPPIFPKESISISELGINKIPKSIEEIINYLYYNISHIDEGLEKDYWQSPKKTKEMKQGDCEDVAMMGVDFAKRLGYKSNLLLLFEGMREGHAVCLLEKKINQKIKYGAIDRNFGFYPQFDSVNELVNYINQIPSENNIDKSRAYTQYMVFDLSGFDVDWKTYDGNLREAKYSKKFFVKDVVSVK